MDFRVDTKVKANSLSPALFVGRSEAGEDGIVGVAGVVDLGHVNQLTGQWVDLKIRAASCNIS